MTKTQLAAARFAIGLVGACAACLLIVISQTVFMERGIEVQNEAGRVTATGPLFHQANGDPALPTVRVSEDGKRWKVEVLGDRYEKRRKGAR